MTVTISTVPWDDADGERLRAAMGVELMARYQILIDEGQEPEDLPAEDVEVFMIARRDETGEAIGCGALRRLPDGSAEVKRMYVTPEARGSGAATAVLRGLEDYARNQGITTVHLTTGTEQPDALRLYEREGYRRTAGFGELAGHPMAIFLARDLG